METTVKKREWVKDAAILFLAVLLVLTFFSNTIMNHSLPEVATSAVGSGNIVAKVRGTGTVTATGKHQVKAKEIRTIRSVMVKAGQEVNVGDVLFVLGDIVVDGVINIFLRFLTQLLAGRLRIVVRRFGKVPVLAAVGGSGRRRCRCGIRGA